ncbi:putative enzyme related to lactoylglutathione lyase [Sporomusaceae bacterium BoRhaA]|uniref:hypothetical protein n=1 Tax=Pelorhabdus rhamnosifermentans TaxID=2772457 RepID=UPI001C060D6D|nr:hypothetical protein [Pelorhabdus rhamnosifermentans]MBU2699441.1 putative enzyme related to lactoylglutathione lyase [Pelorhabdus rhamnosifermentans]
MSKTGNPVVWFEIPVIDMERGKVFYEGVFSQKLNIIDMGQRQMFPDGNSALIETCSYQQWS